MISSSAKGADLSMPYSHEVAQVGPTTRKIIQVLPFLFLIWLTVSVVSPWKDLYKTVFHALVIPVMLVTWRYAIGHRVLEDPFIRIVGVFCAYVGISTFFVGHGSLANDLEVLRWSIEAFFSVIALWICVEWLRDSPALWGRLLLTACVVGAGLGFLSWDGGRVEGFGALSHPIQGTSILLAYLAMGCFLLTQGVPRWRWEDCLLIFLGCSSVASFAFLSQSRGPILAFCIYFFVLLPFVTGRNLKLTVSLLALVLVLSGAVIEWHEGLDSFLNGLIERGDSKRLEIWKGYLLFPPDSLLLGYGAGTEPEQMRAAAELWRPNNYVVTHAHNLWLGTYAETGIIGVLFLVAIFGMLSWAALARVTEWSERAGLLGIISLVLMLTFTDEHTLVLSMKPIWLLAWLPMVLVWQWAREPISGDTYERY